MNIQNSENFVDKDLEFDSEPDNNDNTEEIGSSSKSSNNQKTTGLPKKKKKRKLIAKAWQYFSLVGSSAICQVEIVEDRKTKKCGRIYDHSNSNSTTTMNYHITQEHDIVLQKGEVKIIRFNQILALEMDEEIDSKKGEDDEEIDVSTIKILRNISDITSVLLLKKGKENQKDDSENEDDNTLYAPPPPPDLDQIEKNFKIPATLLDPQTKKIPAFTNREREKAREKLKNEFENLQHLNFTDNYQPEQQTSTPISTEIMQNPFFEGIFGAQSQDTPLDE
ncbi:17688_t:CDS:2, partial [Racocetra fulgida]